MKEAMKLALEALENAREIFTSIQEIGIRNGASSKDVRLGETFIADRAIKALEEALAQSQSDVKQSVSVEQGGWHTHDLYTDADKDRPDVICDSNGQVTLGLCKRCGRGEAELETPCDKPKQEQEPVAEPHKGEPQPALYVKDIDGNFHLHKEKGHTENCVAFGDDCSENHLSPSRFGVGKNNSTTKQEHGEPDDLTIAYMSGLHRGKDLAQQRTWVGLTEEDLQKILQEVSGQGWKPMLEAIEAKLKEKNT